MRYVILLLLSGCAVSTNELYRIANECVGDCTEEWQAVESRENALLRREKSANPCSAGMVAFKSRWGTECIDHGTMREILRGWQ